MEGNQFNIAVSVLFVGYILNPFKSHSVKGTAKSLPFPVCRTLGCRQYLYCRRHQLQTSGHHQVLSRFDRGPLFPWCSVSPFGLVYQEGELWYR
jgi:hypothetical protein